jgi:hypothetical protein
MKKEKTKVWFKAKCYGWGWYPSTWQGALVILIWAVLFTFSLAKLDHEGWKNILFIIFITALLILISWKKGEKPRWRWGK